MNNFKTEYPNEYTNYQKTIKSIIGKSCNLTVDDLIKYLKIHFNADIYNSYDALYYDKISKKNRKAKNKIDFLALDIIKGEHKAVAVPNYNKIDKNKIDFFNEMYFSYKNNKVTDIFIQVADCLPDRSVFLFIEEN